MSWRIAFSFGRHRLLGGFAAALLVVLVFAVPADGQNFSPWSPAVNLGPVVNFESCEGCPSISQTGLSLYPTRGNATFDTATSNRGYLINRKGKVLP